MHSMNIVRMLKRSLGLYPIHGIHCSTSLCSNSGNVSAGKVYDHLSAGLEYHRDGRSEMDRDKEGQSRGYRMTSLQTVPCYIAGMLALSCWKRKLFLTV